MSYVLKSVVDPTDWESWHTIREQVLWEARGEFGTYDRSHPTLASPNHYPFLLLHDSDTIGAIAIEILGNEAWLRRVAIREDAQNNGHGRTMMHRALDFARGKGCTRASSNVHIDAVGFYRKLGFDIVQDIPDHGPRMSIAL